MKVAERERARVLRRDGLSIGQIVSKIGCSKASVSIWVRDIILTEVQKKQISKLGRSVKSIEKRRMNRLGNEEIKRKIIIEEAKKDINSISHKELKIIGNMLYLGEGGKSKRLVRFSNSNPIVIVVMMRFFREICSVEEKKFRGHIHTFSHANIKNTERYWSKISGIPKKQFYKTYIKQSIASLNKKDTIPYGTFDIYVNDTKLFLKITGWITRICDLVIKNGSKNFV